VNTNTLRNPISNAARSPKVKVLYVAGWGRSGSTILGRILGQIQGFFLVGELRYIWDRGLIENRLCSCGASFMKCPLWQEVVSRTLGNDDHVAVEKLVALRERELHTRHLLLTPTLAALQARVARMEGYSRAVEQLYHAVQHVSGARVIVDTSKFPSYGFVLQNLPSIELYVLHLVRDPRAVAYSWKSRRKVKLDEDGSNKLMTSHGFGKSSLVWDEWNLAIEKLRRQEPERYMLLRYEDFVASPRRSTKGILRFLGEEAELPFMNERQVRLDVPHTFSGNPDRFSAGNMVIMPDEGWKHSLSYARQLMVAALTWPGLVRYGYPLLPQLESSLHDRG
jgi:hypothetical protein